MDPAKYNLKQAWNALREARKGNGISKAIYRTWAARNAMPYDTDPECKALQTYEQFTRHHVKVWYID